MKTRFILLSLITLFFIPKEGKTQGFLGGVHLKSGIPIGDFNEETGIFVLPEVGFGILHGIQGTPIFVGAELGYGRYGTAVNRRSDIFPGVNQRFRIRRNNNYVNLMGVVRLMAPEVMRFRPFVEGQIGGIHTFTRSHIRENRLADPIASGTERYDWAMMVQVGAGLLVPLNSTRDTFLEVKLNYVDSGQMDYLTKNSAYYIEPGELVLSPKRSGFNMLQPSVAVRFNFD
ncbi:MAG TPA: hypothetical protein VK957_05730 [Lunatimonas sp.]|nr:hypothetical protein [Lunatimonas sp.]